MEKKKTLYVPHDLIIEILLRLPVISLLRFKCVRKLWLSLISDPYFTNSHFQMTIATHTPGILFLSNDLRKTLSLDFQSKLQFTKIPSPNFLHPQSRIEIISSCRGFIFLLQSSKFHLWNPCTVSHKQIPLSLNESNVNNLCYLYGFGYDKLRDDYLVVTISYDQTLYDSHSHLEFFTLKDNIWREIEGTRFPYTNNTWRCLSPRVGTLFNENINWLASNEESGDNVILAFNITERKLVEMPYPDDFECEQDEDCELWVFGEFLSLFSMNFYDNDTVEIWVMKEYKVHSSWIKTHVLHVNGIPTQYFTPICSTKSGNIFGTDYTARRLVMYNKKGKLRKHESYYGGPLGPPGHDVTTYTKSLLSLPSNNV
jgi:F-box interacting protein